MTNGTAPRVGMVGAGQLARMTHQAAIALGVELTVLAETPDAPAVAAGARRRPGEPDDLAALHALARSSDVVTFDHERIPRAHLEELERSGHVVRPAPAVKALAQDKLHARRVLRQLGFPVPHFAPAESVADIERLAARSGWPVVLKARHGGYDGRGVHVVRSFAEAGPALDACGGDAVVEEMVDIATEVAMMVARRPGGSAVAYPAVETVQVDGMCRELVAPARIDPGVAEDARTMALALAEETGATGILAVELFVATDGALRVNELALRPHNSGHWTIEGAATSQFEQHLRAVLDWPLGSTALRAPAVATVNVVGRAGVDVAAGLPRALAVPGAAVHLYGKAGRPGRKLGHVTALGDDPASALATARTAAAHLEGR